MKLDVVYEYVKNYFKDNFLEAYLIFDGRIDYIDKKYGELFDKEIKNKYNIDDVKNNENLDEINLEVHEILNRFVLEYFTDSQVEDCKLLYNYVRDLLIKREVNQNFSDDIFNHIVKLVMARTWSQYDKSRLGKDDFDHVINLIYNNSSNQYARMIDRNIEKILDSRLDFFEIQKLGIDKSELKRYVINEIFTKERRDFLIKMRSLVVSSDGHMSRIGMQLNKYINEYFAKYLEKYSVCNKFDKD